MEASFRVMSPNPIRISLKRNKSNHLMTTPSEMPTTSIKRIPHYSRNSRSPNFLQKSTVQYKQRPQNTHNFNSDNAGIQKHGYKNKAGSLEDKLYHEQIALLNETISDTFESQVRHQTNFQTHSYVCFEKEEKQKERSSLKKFNVSKQYKKIPAVIEEIYEQRRAQSILNQQVHFVKGYLKAIGYFYYAIENQLIFISHHQLLSGQSSRQSNSQIEILQLIKPALSVTLLELDGINLPHEEIHPFGRAKNLLIISHNWELSFYQFDELQPSKFKSLKLKISLPCQISTHFIMSKSGNLYYLDEKSALSRIEMKPQYSCFKEKRYSIKNYLFFKSPSIERRRNMKKNMEGKWLNFFAERCSDIKYFFKKKINKPLQILYDPISKIIYTLSQTSLKNELKTAHKEIRIYQVETPPQSSLSKFLWKFEHTPPTLIKKITQEELYNTIGEHFFLHLQAKNFRIKGIQLIRKNVRPTANLLVILDNGSRMYLDINEQRIIMVEVIHLPDIELLRENKQSRSYQVLQKESNNLKLVDYEMHESSWVVVVSYCRKLIWLQMSSLGIQKEEVSILCEEGEEGDRSYCIAKSDYALFRIPMFRSSISSKRKAYLHMIKNYESLVTNQEMWLQRESFALTVKNIMKKVSYMRSIDILYQVIYNINTHQSIYSSNSHFLQIYEHFRRYFPEKTVNFTLQLLLQIYCDREGNYLYRIINRQYNSKQMHIDRDTSNCLFVEEDFDQISVSSICGIIQNIFRSPRTCENESQAIYSYIGKLLMPIWRIKIYEAQRSLYSYYHSVIIRMISLINVKMYDQISSFLNFLIQTLNLIREVPEISYLSLQQILGCQRQILEEPLFYSFMQHQGRQKNRINIWSQNFPSFVSNRLVRTIRFTSELAEKSKEEAKKIIITSANKFPFYLITYLQSISIVDQQTFKLFLLKTTSTNKIDVSQIMPPKQSTPFEKYHYCIKEAKKPRYTWNQKQFLVITAEENLGMVKGYPNFDLLKKKSQLAELKKIIGVQRQLKEQVGREGIMLSSDTQELINHVTLSKDSLQKLLTHLNFPKLTFLFYANFGGSTQVIKGMLRDFSRSQVITKMKTSQQIRKLIVEQIYQKLSDCSLSMNLPLALIMSTLNEMVYRVNEGRVLEDIKKEGLCERQCKIFWVPFELYSWGYNRIEIFETLKKTFQKAEQSEFLYYLLVCLILFVKFQFRSGLKELSFVVKAKQRETKIHEGTLAKMWKIFDT